MIFTASHVYTRKAPAIQAAHLFLFLGFFLVLPIAAFCQSSAQYYATGLKKVDLGNYSGALVDLNKSILLNPRSDQAYELRGSILLNLGDLQGALSDYNQAILKTLPGDTYLARKYNYRGMVRHKLHDSQGAMEDYTRSIELLETLSAYSNRGDVKLELSDYRGAIGDFTLAIAMDPTNKYCPYFDRGNAFALLKEYKPAVSDYSLAIQVSPTDNQAYYNRGLGYLHLGNKVQGCEDLHKAGELGNSAAAQAIAGLCK